MAEHLYEGGLQKVTSTAAAPLCEIIPATLAAGKRLPEIREIGVSNVSGVAAEIGLGRPAATGRTPGTITTVQAGYGLDVIAGNTTIAATWGTAPTSPSPFMRRWQLQGVVGAGVIWTWGQGEFALWAAGGAGSTIVLWQFGSVAVTYDVYVKVAE